MKEDSNYLDQFLPYFEEINKELGKVIDSEVSLIEEVGSYTLLGEGKRLRPLFFILSCQLCDYNDSDVYALSTIFECLHAASLLHDDVLDNAHLRRGRSSVNKLWGNSAAVLMGDFLFSNSSRMAAEKNNVEFLKRLADTATRMIEGQMLELVHTHNWNITRAEYLEIITFKTAVLISTACASGGIVSGADQERVRLLEKFGLNTGIAFQILDDVLDYTSTVEEAGKPIGNDLREGKITLPLIYTIASLDESEKVRLKTLFKNGFASERDYSTVIELVQQNGAIGKCRKDAQHYVDISETYLKFFPDSEVKGSLSGLNRFIANRTC